MVFNTLKLDTEPQRIPQASSMPGPFTKGTVGTKSKKAPEKSGAFLLGFGYAQGVIVTAVPAVIEAVPAATL